MLDRRRSLAERIGPVDDRCDLAGFDELGEHEEVRVVLPREERAELLAQEHRQQ